MKSKKNSNWKYYIVELFVLFVGVTAGFLLNTWRQDNAEIELERKYLSSFYNDVLSDEGGLDSLIIRSQIKTDTLMNILRKADLKNLLLTEELAQKIVKEILYLEWFAPANDTYEDIKNSGNLNLVSDFKLKERISSYYKYLIEVKNVEQFYKDHMNNYGFPLLYKNYHLLKLEFISKKSYQNLEFTNMYLGTIAFLQQNIKVYKEAIVKNRELKDELVKVLDLEGIPSKSEK